MEFSPYQNAIFDFVEHKTGSAVITAVAGSGKTFTIVECANRLPQSQSTMFVAFNKSIAEELASRMPAHIEARTLNSVGNRALGQCLGNRWTKLDGRKTFKLIDECVNPMERRLYAQGLRKLVGLAKSHGIVPAGTDGTALMLDTEQNWADLIEHYGVEFERDADPIKGIAYARAVLKASNACGDKLIDFDDQLYLPVIWGARFQSYDNLFVDEAQDVNAVQRAMLKMSLKPGGRLIAVGDEHQCQPEGTMVMLEGCGEMPIEEIKVGQRVVSYNRHPGNATVARLVGLKNQGRAILKTARRPYEGDLIRVETGLQTSRYTPEHKTLVRFRDSHRDWYAVYLMIRNNVGRIGCSQLWYDSGNGFGPALRARQEKAEKLWVLAVYPNRRLALNAERIICGRHGLLLQTFMHPGNLDSDITQSDIDEINAQIGENLPRVHEALTAFGRHFDFPLWTDTGTDHISTVYPFLSQACNLISETMEVITTATVPSGTVPKWLPIFVSRESYAGFVYSLEVETHHLYVADRILTSNSIYGFRGSDTESIANIKAEFAAIELPLSVSYRCPKAVVKVAQQYVSHIEPSETAPEGEVKFLEVFEPDTFLAGDAVVCRNSAPLVGLAFGLLHNGKPCKILGREIGQGLIKLIDQMSASTLDDLELALHRYHERESLKLIAKGKEDQAEALDDRIQSIYLFIAALPEDKRSIDALKKWIEDLFSDSQGIVTLCTVHKAKGLEWERVFILDPQLMPSKWARQEWQQQQERNIAYVAVTRAKSSLIYITSKGFVDKVKQLRQPVQAAEPVKPQYGTLSDLYVKKLRKQRTKCVCYDKTAPLFCPAHPDVNAETLRIVRLPKMRMLKGK